MMQFLIHVLSGVIGLFITCGIWVVACWLHDMVTGHRDEDEEREEDEECEEEGRREVSENARPRNCDVGTAEEQYDRFIIFCRQHKRCNGCSFEKLFDAMDGIRTPHICGLAWAQMPYEEGRSGMSETAEKSSAVGDAVKE